MVLHLRNRDINFNQGRVLVCSWDILLVTRGISCWIWRHIRFLSQEMRFFMKTSSLWLLRLCLKMGYNSSHHHILCLQVPLFYHHHQKYHQQKIHLFRIHLLIFPQKFFHPAHLHDYHCFNVDSNTTYPISSSLSYCKISPSHLSYINTITKIPIPQLYSEAKDSKEWCEAVDKEFGGNGSYEDLRSYSVTTWEESPWF